MCMRLSQSKNILLLVATIISSLSYTVKAQVWSGQNIFSPSSQNTQVLSGLNNHSWTCENPFDASIKQIKMVDAPNFRYYYDDYLQYSPAAVLLIMKACGAESMSENWGRMLSADAFSAVIMASLVNGIKYTAKRLRPDGSSYNSFPSGHTATAFLTASLLHKEYGWKYPWISFGAYSVASITGFSRILNNRHWASDVLMGAGIGVASAELGYLINKAIFRDRYLSMSYRNYFEQKSYEYSYDCPQHDIEEFYAYRLGAHSGSLSGSSVYLQASYGIPTSRNRNSSSSDTSYSAETNTYDLEDKSYNTEEESNNIKYTSDDSKYGDGKEECKSYGAKDRWKIRIRLGLNSYSSTENLYNTMAGIVYSYPFAKILELEAGVLTGAAFNLKASSFAEIKASSFAEINLGLGLNLIVSEHFKLKAIVENDSLLARGKQFNSFLFGIGAGFYF